jgi:hypothetical protein
MLVRSRWTNSFSGIQWRGKKEEMRTSARRATWKVADNDTVLSLATRGNAQLARETPCFVFSCVPISDAAVRAVQSTLEQRKDFQMHSYWFCTHHLSTSVVLSARRHNPYHTGSYDILTLGKQPAWTKIVTWDLGRRILINCKVVWRQRLGI